VLDQLSTETQTWTGNEAQMMLRNKTSLVTASWDTMGWIYFKEAKLALAEAWIRAAFALCEDAEVGEHLGDLLLAEKQPAPAAEAYAEALASLPTRQLEQRTRNLRTKLEAAKASANLTQTPDGKAGLQARRVWRVSSASGLNGSAEFRVLLGPEGVVFAAPTGTATQPLQARVEGAKWHDRFPPGEKPYLARQVALSCDSRGCDLVIEP
jgi:hypothetical protein